jgi:hypothetical protein
MDFTSEVIFQSYVGLSKVFYDGFVWVSHFLIIQIKFAFLRQNSRKLSTTQDNRLFQDGKR